MPRRARGPFTLYARNGWWWCQFRVSGRRHRLPTGESERSAAESRALALWQEAKARAGASVGDGSQPLKQIAGKLHVHAQRLGRADSYARDLEIDLRLHVLTRWQTVGEITTAAWDAAMLDLHTDGLSWRSVQRVAKHVRMLLRHAVKVGALASEPVIHSPRREQIVSEAAPREALSAADRDRLLAHFRKRGNERAALVYTVLFYTGLRRNVVASIVPRWIDFKGKTLTVPAGVMKNRTALTLALHPKALRALREAMGSIAPGEPVFGPFDYSNLFWASVRRLGIDPHGLTPHHIGRHTAATLLAEAGASTIELQATLGWRTREMADRYTHPSADLSRAALRRLR